MATEPDADDKSMKLGGGGRFAKLKGQLADKGASNPGALAAYIGRKKLGKAKFQALAAKGRSK
jgi:hypothetical protein